MMYRLLISFLLIVLTSTSQAQMYRVDSAIKFLESDSISSALREINFAIRHARTSEYPRTWRYYYEINLKKYQRADSKTERDEIIPLLLEGYGQCKIFDTDQAYLPKIDSSFRSFTQYYKDNAREMLNENLLNDYVYFQEVYIACLHAIGRPVGFQYFQLGESNMKLRDYAMALEDFQNAIEQDFRAEESYLNRLILLDELGQTKEAELVYVKALQSYPNSEKLHYLDIHKYLYKQLSFRAKSSINELINNGESGADLYMMLGDANDQMSLFDEAVEAYEMAIKADSSDFYNCLKVGGYLLDRSINLGDRALIAQAQMLLKTCEQSDPDDLVLLQSLRKLYVETKNIEEFNRVNNRIEFLTN